MRSRFFGELAIMALVSMGFCLVVGFDDSALAQDFDNASLNGRYAGTVFGRGGQGREYIIGVMEFDGAGGFTNHFFGNSPAHPFPTRVFMEFNNEGTYNVRQDGRGTLRGTNPEEPDPTHFVIAASQGGRATKVCFVIDDLSVGIGSLRSGCLDRVSGRNLVLNQSSLNGRYGGLLVTEGGRAPVSVTGLVIFKGDGTFGVRLHANIPAFLSEQPGTPLFGMFPQRIVENIVRVDAGTYTVQEDGLCEMVGNNPNPAEQDPTHCVITGVITEDQMRKATRVDICFRNEGVPAGGLTCGTATLQQ